jgi:hypothetical protein
MTLRHYLRVVYRQRVAILLVTPYRGEPATGTRRHGREQVEAER